MQKTWRDQARCKGKTHLFFPEQGASFSAATKEAKALCADCPVKVPCIEASHGQEGIWGGLVERQRRKLRRTA